ncbi:Rft protein-domain-containing protein [Halenospora varia]|nr:Rft protein-domain-containing protein [Halenospora varia]
MERIQPVSMDSPPESQPRTKPSLLTTSAGGAGLLIGLQVGSRALTFVVNQILLRYLSPALLGISTQLEVYSITVLFFARESLRVAIQRQTDDSQDEPRLRDEKPPKGHVNGRTAAGKTQAIVNLAYVSIPLGVLFAVGFAWLYLLSDVAQTANLETTHFHSALAIYGLAAIWELFAEPCFVVAQYKSQFKIRAASEATATLLRCLTTCGSAIWASRTGRDLGILPFAIGQATYALSLWLVYNWRLWSMASTEDFSMKPTPIFSSNPSAYLLSYFSRPLLALGASIFVQSIVKHVLTQGDTFLIAYLASPIDQGIYALANNYGGLLARLILQPVEESSRNYFGKLLSTVDGQPSKDAISKAKTSLSSLLRAYILLSVCVLSVGPTIAPLLLNLVAGPRWAASGAGEVLATYCYYIPLLAINGVTEAFVSSVATESDVNRQSLWMLAFSAGFGGGAFVFLRLLQLGAQGLVWANVLNMAFRIVWSSTFISSFLRHHGSTLALRQLIPQPSTVAAAVGIYAILARLQSGFNGGLFDLLKSGSIALIFVVILIAGERKYLLECYQSIRGNAKQEK